MYGTPIPRPKDAIVLRPHWRYLVKRDGTRRSRNCCDGSPCAAPSLHAFAMTYSSCVEQPIQCLFFALSAHMGYRVYGGDAQDAYAHSPPPEVPTFVSLDSQYIDWYEHKHNIKLDPSHVLPVQHALQGHPESGRLWEAHINKILTNIGFKNTVHDKCIYQTTYRGTKILLLRQVDDFSIASPSETLAKEIYNIIGTQLQLPDEKEPPFKYLGLLADFNGIDIIQSADRITLSCSHYISRVLTTHGWSTPEQDTDTSNKPTSPIPADSIDAMYNTTGPGEGTKEHAKLADKSGFSYRSLLGELMYAYVTCRPDIGYSVTTLSKFSTCPSPTHYQLLKGVALYL